MFNIEKYLEKFTKKIDSNDRYTKEIKQEIKRITGIEIVLSDIELKEFVVYIKCSPGVKNRIFINKNKILENFSKNIDTKIIDIR